MHAQGAQQVGVLVVVGEKCAAVAIAAQGLGREEGGGADVSERTGSFAVDAAAEALGAVFDTDGPKEILGTNTPSMISICR